MNKFTLFFLIAFSTIFAQSLPSDFKFVGTTGGAGPWAESKSITILANGQVEFVKIKGNPYQILLDTTFSISSSKVQEIWQVVQNNNFYSLDNGYRNDSIMDGSLAVLTITANGTAKQVIVKNSVQQEIQNIIMSVNSKVPSNYNLDYTPPEIINIVPNDPCNSIFGSISSSAKNIISKAELDKLQQYSNSNTPLNTEDQNPHAGVEIGYEESLYDAVGNGTASLKGKGGFFGDDVSITGNYKNNFTPPDNIIHIKLNLEFYGPCDNAANELKIVKDIYKKWNGLTTSNGKKIEMEITSLSKPGATSPPGTSGYDNIKLACGNGRSFVDKVGAANDGVDGGTWYPSDNEVGTFGHEVGHLMGLKDQYDDYAKQADGSWKNAKDGTNLSASEFTNLYNTKNGTHLTQNDLNKSTLLSIAKDGHENDLMANVSKPPLQSDVDFLADKAGLIINIKPGDILVNNDNYYQNFVVSHLGDLFLKPGEKRTLNGIYAACIDHFKGGPYPEMVFAVAPSLDKWKGINAAQSLLKVVKYIDSLDYYCGSFEHYFAQEAIWRITDNFIPSDPFADSLLINAGIDVNKYFDFPKLTFNLDNSDSSQYIPEQLFAAHIEPKIIDAKINEKTDFTATVSAPSVGNFTTNFLWVLNSPNSNSDQLAANGANAELTPLQRGVYSLNLDINVKDSIGTERDFLSSNTAYAVVADKYTETFENNNLTEIFPWKTYGDAPWEITNKNSQSGIYSIQPGKISGNKTSTLEITVDVPSDTTLEFGLIANTNLGSLELYIDDSANDYYYENNKWDFYSYDLYKGKHILKWVYQSFLGETEAKSPDIYLDNLFFPTNSILITSVEPSESIPPVFNLYQNYPNPFNPITNIRYQLPTSGHVTLKVYDVLGNEVVTLLNEEKQAGNYEIEFNAAGLSSGIYFYKLKSSSFVETKKMLLLK